MGSWMRILNFILFGKPKLRDTNLNLPNRYQGYGFHICLNVIYCCEIYFIPFE